MSPIVRLATATTTAAAAAADPLGGNLSSAGGSHLHTRQGHSFPASSSSSWLPSRRIFPPLGTYSTGNDLPRSVSAQKVASLAN